jgi:glyoxylase-like metal-dependent hydrolase (beta-lactamase superfamily II)
MKNKKYIGIITIVIGFSAIVFNQTATTAVEPNPVSSRFFKETWRAGQQSDEPDFHIQKLDTDTIVIRQSLRDTFEAPFMYLLFGDEKALLIDTGVKNPSLRKTIDKQIDEWLSSSQKTDIELVVMHSHGHGDHIGNDDSFHTRPNTKVIGTKPEDVAKFFNVTSWPETKANFDLGNRNLTIIPTPGHHPSHVMVHDPNHNILFSGDMVYPGKLYFQCAKANTYLQSLNRIINFAQENNVQWLLGGHIELPYNSKTAYPFDQKVRKDEHHLELPVEVLSRIKTALTDMGPELIVNEYDSFTLFPHPADPQGKQPPNWCNE